MKKRKRVGLVETAPQINPVVAVRVNNSSDNLNRFLVALGCFILLLLAGMGYALYLRLYCTLDHNTMRAHLLQWVPFVSAIGALIFGVRRMKADTPFSEFGQIGVFAAAMPVGYVLGRLLFF